MADKERLLTDEEFHKLHEDFFGEGSGTCCEIDDTDLCYRVAKAQLAKDEARIEALIEDFEQEFFRVKPITIGAVHMTREAWEKFKATHTSNIQSTSNP